MLNRIDQLLDRNSERVGYLLALAVTATGAYVIWVCVGIGLSRGVY